MAYFCQEHLLQEHGPAYCWMRILCLGPQYFPKHSKARIYSTESS